MKFTAAADKSVPVLIVGGGGGSLTASMLLARQGVERLLVGARPGESDLPADDPLGQLAGAIGQILARPVATRPVAAGSAVTS